MLGVLAGSMILLFSFNSLNLSFIPSNPSIPARFKSFRLTGLLFFTLLLVTVTYSSSSYSSPDALAISFRITGMRLIPKPMS